MMIILNIYVLVDIFMVIDLYFKYGLKFFILIENVGWFFFRLKENFKIYLQFSSNGVKDWLKELKGDKRVVFLMIFFVIDFVGLVIEIVFGQEFDFC